MKKKSSNISVGNISNISGSQINISGGGLNIDNDGSEFIGGAINSSGINVQELNVLLQTVGKLIDATEGLSKGEKADLKADTKEAFEEIKKNNQADISYIARRLRNLKRMAPDIMDVIINSLISPALGAATVARKIANKIKSDT